MENAEIKIDDYKRKNPIKKAWDWIWHSNSIFSWIVALILMYVFVKFIFFSGLGLIFGTSLPLAGVESSSMDHTSLKYCLATSPDFQCISYSSDYEICGQKFDEKNSFNLDKYWETCGSWYEEENIDKNQFNTFTLKNGFNKGDVMIVWGRFTPKIGDVIIFKPNADSIAPNPIIHRIVKIDEKDGKTIYQTKGDHNSEQLTKSNNIYNTDETYITREQMIGKAVARIPLLGYPKLIFVKIINLFR